LDITPLQTALLLYVVAFAGALLPLYRRWSDRGLHVLVSVSAGVFLGTVFLHLLPHLAGVRHGAGGMPEAAGPGREHGGAGPWIAALGGLLLLFVLERVWLRPRAERGGGDPHATLWTATWVGLAIHSLTEGIALAAILDDPAIRSQLLFSILVHKATEAFSLATVMRLANLGNGRSLGFLALFALAGPVGLFAGRALAGPGGELQTVLTGLACGTFLYVAVCDLLPEVFHGADRRGLKLASVLVGIGATALTLPRLSGTAAFLELTGREVWTVFVTIAPVLLLGFLLAGVLNEFLKAEWLTRHVAREGARSVTLASLIGAPLPLCSCSVLPVAAQLRRAGASKGATSAFVIATPETGVDSVSVSWALLGPFLAVARFLGAVVSAIVTGTAVSWFVRRGLDREEAEQAPSIAACCEAAPDAGRGRPRGRAARVVRYAFIDMMDDLSPSLVVGLLLSGAIGAALPAELLAAPAAQGLGGKLAMLAIGIPIYVCATASTPIAAALMLKGLSPGAAFVFLLASPATNIGSLVVLTRILGKRVVAVQLVVLALVTLALGWVVDLVYPALGGVLPGMLAPGEAHGPGWFATACAVVLAALLAGSLVRTRSSWNPLAGMGNMPEPIPR